MFLQQKRVISMNNKQLTIFNKVAETGSINKAAKELGIDFARARYQIEQLEKEFGCEFFFRGVEGCRLTEEGKRFYEYSLKLEELYLKMKGDFEEIKEFRVGVDPTCVPEILVTATNKVCDDLKIKTEFIGYDPDYFLPALEKGTIHCLYNYEFDTPKTVECESVFTDHMIVILSKKSSLYSKETIDYSDLLNTEIYFKHRDTRGSRKMATRLAMFSNDYRINYGISLDSVKSSIKEGRGVMIVPYYFWKYYLNELEYREFRNKIKVEYCVYYLQQSTILKKIIRRSINSFRSTIEKGGY